MTHRTTAHRLLKHTGACKMKTNVLNSIISNSVYLGYFQITDDSKMVFETFHRKLSGQRNKKFFDDLGDIVYFMLVRGQLMKIGKAAGLQGWYGRINMYQKGIKGDHTNKMIIQKMRDMKESRIDIVAVRSPRALTPVKCPLTNKIMKIELETAAKMERVLTNRYLSEAKINSLPFCSQLG